MVTRPENVYENVRKELKPTVVKECLDAMWVSLCEGGVVGRVAGAKEEAGNDVIEVIKLIFPIIVDIQIETIAKFGCPPNKDGLRDFLVRVNELSSEDDELRDKLLRMRSLYLAPYEV